jgi:hypothetical protein
MSPLVARIVLAILVMPLAVVLYIGIAAVGTSTMDDEEGFALATAIVGSFVVVYWIMLWRRSVRWTRDRVTKTAMAGGAAVIAGVLVGLAGGAGLDPSFGVFIGGAAALILWLVAATLLWQETPEERAARVRDRAPRAVTCPACGYNLTGLATTVCPECGAKYTLDELFASQPEREAEQLE